MRYPSQFVAILFLLAAVPAMATVFGEVQGIVHDPQHRPIVGAKVVVQERQLRICALVDD